MGSAVRNAIPIKEQRLLETRGLVAGQWRTAKDGKTFSVYEPSSGDVLRECSDLGHADFLEAIDSAELGYREFSKSTTAKERGQLLRRWHDLMIANVDDCMLILVLRAWSHLTVNLQWLLFYPWRTARPWPKHGAK